LEGRVTGFDPALRVELRLELAALLVAAAVALWAYLAFVLGPTLWLTNRRAFVIALAVAGIPYGWLLTRVVAAE
jgi:hypothetical protein